MSHWNYRVGWNAERQSYAIYSAYYSDAGEVVGWAAEPAMAESESIAELRAELLRMIAALDESVLDVSDGETDVSK